MQRMRNKQEWICPTNIAASTRERRRPRESDPSVAAAKLERRKHPWRARMQGVTDVEPNVPRSAGEFDPLDETVQVKTEASAQNEDEEENLIHRSKARRCPRVAPKLPKACEAYIAAS